MRRFLFGLGIFTILALVYVQQKVSLVSLGYRMETLRRTKEDLLDQNRVLHYNVLTLKSPVILNRRLSKVQVELAPPLQVEVVAPFSRLEESVAKPSWASEVKRSVVRWLTNGKQAVAEPAPGDR